MFVILIGCFVLNNFFLTKKISHLLRGLRFLQSHTRKPIKAIPNPPIVPPIMAPVRWQHHYQYDVIQKQAKALNSNEISVYQQKNNVNIIYGIKLTPFIATLQNSFCNKSDNVFHT